MQLHINPNHRTTACIPTCSLAQLSHLHAKLKLESTLKNKNRSMCFNCTRTVYFHKLQNQLINRAIELYFKIEGSLGFGNICQRKMETSR